MHTVPLSPEADPTPPVARPAPPDLRDQLMLLGRHWLLIVGLGAACGAAGTVYSITRARQFEATATVSVSGSRLVDQAAVRVAPETFVPLMTTQAVAAEVLDELKLPGVTAAGLLTGIVTVRAVPESSLIRIVARTEAPDLAASVANSFATHAVAAATRASRIDVDDVEGQLKRMLDEATTRLREAEKAYDDYRVSARVEMLQREVETLVSQRG
ncbi:MAG TPA: hypothetical protein VMW48_05395, partial [Vicinamibacterales bacterium]|nr:hypothetical protein [Vicinamibacterales bacterium]